MSGGREQKVVCEGDMGGEMSLSLRLRRRDRERGGDSFQAG